MKHSLSPLLFLSVFAAHASEADLRTTFTWTQPIEGTFDAGTLYRVPVNGAVFDGSLRFPDDLRIIDDAGTQWPFYLWLPRASRKFAPQPSKILNRSVVEDAPAHLLLEVSVGNTENKTRLRHNQLRLNTGGHDFIRKVDVQGSADRTTWGTLGEGYLIDHPGHASARNEIIQYAESDYPYLRMRIHPNARNLRETIKVSSLAVGEMVMSPGQWEDIPLQAISQPDDKIAEGATAHYFDTGFGQRPIERLVFTIPDTEFARPVTVYGRQTSTNAWRSVKSGELHRLGSSEQLHLSLQACTYRALKIKIQHFDDEPIEITSVKAAAAPRYLTFEARSSGPASLYYGSRKTVVARYDVARRKGAQDAANALEVQLGAREPNAQLKSVRSDKWVPLIAGTAVGLVSLIVIWVVAGMLRKGGTQLVE